MRHAQRHWLEIQARVAVDKAMDFGDILGLADEKALNSCSFELLSNHRDRLLKEAAKNLVFAEMAHRALTGKEKNND